MKILLTGLLALLTYSLINAQNHSDLWLEDLEFFKTQVYETLPGSGDRIDQKEFDRRFAALKDAIPLLTRDEIVMELQALLALAHDNDCFIYPFQESIKSQILPLKTYYFYNGLYVCDAGQPYKELIGEEIVKVNGLETKQLFEKLKPVLPADNENYQRYQFSMYCQIPAFLEWAVGSKTGEDVAIESASGETMKVRFEDVEQYVQLERNLASQAGLGQSADGHEGENYWMEFLSDNETLFIQLREISDSENGESFRGFVKQLQSELESGKVEKLVIDNRYGGGGNGFKLKKLTDLIQGDDNINQHGKLFVLTSRATKGTLLEFTSILQLNTKAVIVGEPTGEGPNLVGDRTVFTLPNSSVKVFVTNKFWATSFSFDSRRTITPQVEIHYSFSDYVNGDDPWLGAIESYDSADASEGALPKKLSEKLVGNYKVDEYKLRVYEEDGELYLSVKRKFKSFFELHTEIYFATNGELTTDIPNVKLFYDSTKGENALIAIDWFGKRVNF